MLMHSCYCIFISVTGGFVQMLKDFKNLLKMSLKILFIKRKRKFPSIPPFPLIRPAGLSFRAAQLPPLLAFSSLPACRPSPRGPAAHQQPSAALSSSLTGRARLSAPPPTSRIPRPLPVKAEPPFSALASWERPPSCPSASLKGSRAPPRAPLLPRSNFAPLTHRRPQQPSFRGRRISPSTSARAAVSEPSPPPIFARGELAVVPSLSPCVSFRVSWLLAPFPQASASSMPPAMAPAPRLSPPAVFSARARPPSSPELSGAVGSPFGGP